MPNEQSEQAGDVLAYALDAVRMGALRCRSRYHVTAVIFQWVESY
jgi:hypothetical protein